jgi:hypothetical protein
VIARILPARVSNRSFGNYSLALMKVISIPPGPWLLGVILVSHELKAMLVHCLMLIHENWDLKRASYTLLEFWSDIKMTLSTNIRQYSRLGQASHLYYLSPSITMNQWCLAIFVCWTLQPSPLRRAPVLNPLHTTPKRIVDRFIMF